MNLEKFNIFFIILLICLIIYLSITIYQSITKKSSAPDVGKPFIPFTSEKTKTCSSEKVPCDPNSPNSCNICNDPEHMKCVKVPNGDSVEYLCLPKEPDINCNAQNGGRYIWTGYGFTQQKDWQCLCTKPEIYNGPTCEIKNPSYCSNGTITDINNPLRTICQCNPEKNKLLFRDNNTPMCVPYLPQDGGGENGLYGNYYKSPDWRNVYFMRSDKKQWANDIATEFNYQDEGSIFNILTKYVKDVKNNSTDVFRDVYYLTSDMVKEISSLPAFPIAEFKSDYKPVVPYTYFMNTYLP
jgi:hypothetical protein